MFVSVFEMVEHVLHLLRTIGTDVVVIFVDVLNVSTEFVRFEGGIFALVTEVIFLFFMDTPDVCSEMCFERKSSSTAIRAAFIYPPVLSQVCGMIHCCNKLSANIANFSLIFVVARTWFTAAVDRSHVLFQGFSLVEYRST